MTFSANFDLTAATPALKELYNDQVVHNLVYKDNVTLALIKKNTDFGGKNKPIPLIYGAGQGRSATFASAQANVSAVKAAEFLITSVPDYSIGIITNQVLRQMNTDRKAFIMGAKTVMDGVLRSAGRSLSSSLFRSGTGSIGKILTISSGVITLSDAQSVVQFEVEQTLQANATDGGTPRAAKGYVVAVSRSAGTVTVSTSQQGAAATPAGWQAADFLLMDGDNNLKMSGLSAWIPTSAPSSSAFFGVDRSVDTVRLGGNRYDGTLQSIEEALIDGTMVAAREGGNPDIVVTNYTSFGALEKALGSKVVYIDEKGPAGLMFRGIQIVSPNGYVKVFPDRDCPGLLAYALQLDTWALESAGPAPSILTYEDGAIMMRSATADSAECRAGSYVQLACNAPGYNTVIQLGQ